MNRIVSAMPSELLDPREIEQRFKEVDLASARARSKIAIQLANSNSFVGRVKIVSRTSPR